MRLRPAQSGDIPGMMALERLSAGAAHWSAQQYEALFPGTKQASERRAWIVADELATGLAQAANDAPAILGFLVARKIDAQWELENIVVAETARRRGVGTLLLAELVSHACSDRGSEIFLEVRESNEAARALYRKAGFVEAGLRKSYYSNPSEDGILCRLRFS